MYTQVNPNLTIKVGCKGLFITRTCYHDDLLWCPLFLRDLSWWFINCIFCQVHSPRVAVPWCHPTRVVACCCPTCHSSTTPCWCTSPIHPWPCCNSLKRAQMSKMLLIPKFFDARNLWCNLPKIQTKRPNLRVSGQNDRLEQTSWAWTQSFSSPELTRVTGQVAHQYFQSSISDCFRPLNHRDTAWAYLKQFLYFY